MIRAPRAFVIASLGLAGPAMAQDVLREHLGPGNEGEFGWGALVLADLDSDGITDYAVSDPGFGNHAGTVDVYSGASGSLLYNLHGTGKTGSFGVVVDDAGDMDGDGISDLVVGDYEFDDPGQPFVSEGAVRTYSGSDGSLIRELFGTSNGCSLGQALAALDDLDGDGLQDLLVTMGSSGTTRVYAISAYDGSVLYDVGLDEVEAYVGCFHRGIDRDGDGLRDFAVAGIVGGSSVLRACRSSDGAVLHQVDYASTLVQGVCEIGDLDGDGAPEVLISTTGLGLSRDTDVVSLATGTTLRTHQGSWYRGGYTAYSDAASLPDVDGDGIDDYLLVRRGGFEWSVQVRTGLTGELLHGFATLSASAFAGSRNIVGDLDGDGTPEMLIGDRDYRDPISGARLGRVRVCSSNDLWLDADPNSVDDGWTASLTARGVPAGNAIAIALVDVAGTPTFLLVGLGAADATEALILTDLVPPGLAGLSVTFQAFAIGRTGRVVDSAPETVSFF